MFQSEEYFDEIDTTVFENEYGSFERNLKASIDFNINRMKAILNLQTKDFSLNLEYEDSTTLYVSVITENLNEIENIHSKHREKIASILNDLIGEYNNKYYDEKNKIHLLEAIRHLKCVYDDVESDENQIYVQNKVINLIKAKIKNYMQDISDLSTSLDQEIQNYQENKSEYIKIICDAVKLNCVKQSALKLPKKIKGESINRYNGYVFTRETNYNDVDVSDKFLEMMFVKEYRSIDKLLNITSKIDLQKAILGCGEVGKIDEIWASNYKKFIAWAKKTKSYIKEETTDDSIGNTLGEMSLIYYKFQTSESQDWDILMIDQPEDNISNNRIAEKLLMYFNCI